MKTITSSKPVSLSKAASVLKKFVSKETGAAEAVTAFLRRTTDSFTELVQFHEELGVRRSGKKQKRSQLEGLENGGVMSIVEKHRENGESVGKGKSLGFGEEQSVRYVENGRVGSDVEGSSRKKKKENGEFTQDIEEKVVVEPVSKERKKRRKGEEEESRSFDDSEERHSRKKRRHVEEQ